MKTPIRGIPIWPLLSGMTQGNFGNFSVQGARGGGIERAQSNPTVLRPVERCQSGGRPPRVEWMPVDWAGQENHGAELPSFSEGRTDDG